MTKSSISGTVDNFNTTPTDTPTGPPPSDRTSDEARGPGRPPLGVRRNVSMPAWILEQIEALQAAQERRAGRRVTSAEVIRDVLRAGLFALEREGIIAPGFQPREAEKAARGRGEPV